VLSFFNTSDRLRFLVMVGAIAAPLLVRTAFLVSWMEADSAASGEANAKGGLHYRIQSSSGVTTLPAPLAPLFAPYPAGILVDVNADTDASSAITSAAISGQTKDEFAKVAAFYAGQLGPSASVSKAAVIGKTSGYDVSISADGKSPSGETRFSYYLLAPSKQHAPAP
jgi:hypothetical protein